MLPDRPARPRIVRQLGSVRRHGVRHPDHRREPAAGGARVEGRAASGARRAPVDLHRLHHLDEATGGDGRPRRRVRRGQPVRRDRPLRRRFADRHPGAARRQASDDRRGVVRSPARRGAGTAPVPARRPGHQRLPLRARRERRPARPRRRPLRGDARGQARHRRLAAAPPGDRAAPRGAPRARPHRAPRQPHRRRRHARRHRDRWPVRGRTADRSGAVHRVRPHVRGSRAGRPEDRPLPRPARQPPARRRARQGRRRARRVLLHRRLHRARCGGRSAQCAQRRSQPRSDRDRGGEPRPQRSSAVQSASVGRPRPSATRSG